MSIRARGWCFTLNNWTEEEYVAIQEIKCKYIIIGKEKGEKKETPHLQCYVYFKGPKTWAAIKKAAPRAHIEKANGSGEQNQKYCSKEGDFWEQGTVPKQGARTDLIMLKKAIVDGETVDNLLMDDPVMYHKYGRTMNKIEDLCMRKKFRTEMTQGIWYFGTTGVGKSHKVFQDFKTETHYNVPNDKGWWDGYTQQHTVIYNDFRGDQLRYSDMLNLVDKWPYAVKRRNREPLPFTSKTVYVTSSLPPWEIYTHRASKDSLDQLMRRFKVYELFDDGLLKEWTEVPEIRGSEDQEGVILDPSQCLSGFEKTEL